MTSSDGKSPANPLRRIELRVARELMEYLPDPEEVIEENEAEVLKLRQFREKLLAEQAWAAKLGTPRAIEFIGENIWKVASALWRFDVPHTGELSTASAADTYRGMEGGYLVNLVWSQDGIEIGWECVEDVEAPDLICFVGEDRDKLLAAVVVDAAPTGRVSVASTQLPFDLCAVPWALVFLSLGDGWFR